MEILAAMLERDRERLVGPNRRWDETREAYRYGYDEGAVVMGGRKVRVRKPRVRAASGDGEIMLPTWRWATRHDPLDQRTMQQMLVGVSTRSYAKNLEPPPPGVDRSLAVGGSSVSRRFVAQTTAKVEGFLTRPLGDLDIRTVMIDGTWLGEHLMLVVLGIDAEGQKHILGAVLLFVRARLAWPAARPGSLSRRDPPRVQQSASSCSANRSNQATCS